MSLAGLVQFEKNLRSLMASDAFKKADDAERLKIGWRLLQSKYGGALGRKVVALPEKNKSERLASKPDA